MHLGHTEQLCVGSMFETKSKHNIQMQKLVIQLVYSLFQRSSACAYQIHSASNSFASY